MKPVSEPEINEKKGKIRAVPTLRKAVTRDASAPRGKKRRQILSIAYILPDRGQANNAEAARHSVTRIVAIRADRHSASAARERAAARRVLYTLCRLSVIVSRDGTRRARDARAQAFLCTEKED